MALFTRRCAQVFALVALACSVRRFSHRTHDTDITRRLRSRRSILSLRKNGMVVAQERIAAGIGRDVLARGGNARRCGCRHRIRDGRHLSARGKHRRRRLHAGSSGERRRRLPSIIARAHRPPPRATCFLGDDGKPDTKKSRDQALGIGVPGTVAGLCTGAGKIRLGKIQACRFARARHRIGARRCHDRRRQCRYIA